MNHQELVSQLAARIELPKTQADVFVREFVELIADAVTSGEEVTLIGFGKFKTKESAARQARNPKTGEMVEVPAKKKITFAPSKETKDRSNA